MAVGLKITWKLPRCWADQFPPDDQHWKVLTGLLEITRTGLSDWLVWHIINWAGSSKTTFWRLTFLSSKSDDHLDEISTAFSFDKIYCPEYRCRCLVCQGMDTFGSRTLLTMRGCSLITLVPWLAFCAVAPATWNKIFTISNPFRTIYYHELLFFAQALTLFKDRLKINFLIFLVSIFLYWISRVETEDIQGIC